MNDEFMLFSIRIAAKRKHGIWTIRGHTKWTDDAIRSLQNRIWWKSPIDCASMIEAEQEFSSKLPK